jgi:hypothetical protein
MWNSERGMNANNVIVSFSMAGQNDIIDVEIPDNRPLNDIITQLIHTLGLANMQEFMIAELEMIEPHVATPTKISTVQTALAEDIRDGAWLIAHCARRVSPVQGAVPMIGVLPATPIATGSPAITFQRRELSNDRVKKDNNT